LRSRAGVGWRCGLRGRGRRLAPPWRPAWRTPRCRVKRNFPAPRR
jgi:hypothetical protein